MYAFKRNAKAGEIKESKFHLSQSMDTQGKHLCIVDVRSIGCVVQDSRQRA